MKDDAFLSALQQLPIAEQIRFAEITAIYPELLTYIVDLFRKKNDVASLKDSTAVERIFRDEAEKVRHIHDELLRQL